MTFEDWRDASHEVVQALFASEERRWSRDLGWDTASLWAIVDEGRRRGHVPGWILRSRNGDVLGWTYYLLHDGDLQIGGLTAGRATDLRLLLDRTLESPEASLATSMTVFVYPAPASLISALTRRRFSVRRSLYLTRLLGTGLEQDARPAAGVRIRPFEDRDVFPATRLLATAYHGVLGAQCFAPHGRLDEWARYVRQLMITPACGQWLGPASFVAERAGGQDLAAVVLATQISPATVHVAQIAVTPDARGGGVAKAVLARTCEAALARGLSTITLMVDDENAQARRLYAREGFVEQSAFVYAHRRGHVRFPLNVAGASLGSHKPPQAAPA
jgi:ribosomal protein S18 acetylase RimI-like enzyme